MCDLPNGGLLSLLHDAQCCYSLLIMIPVLFYTVVFFFQAEDGIRDLVRSRGLGDVYKRQGERRAVVVRLVT